MIGKIEREHARRDGTHSVQPDPVQSHTKMVERGRGLRKSALEAIALHEFDDAVSLRTNRGQGKYILYPVERVRIEIARNHPRSSKGGTFAHYRFKLSQTIRGVKPGIEV